MCKLKMDSELACAYVNKKHKLDLCVSAKHIFQERFYSVRNLIYVLLLMPKIGERRRETTSPIFFPGRGGCDTGYKQANKLKNSCRT